MLRTSARRSSARRSSASRAVTVLCGAALCTPLLVGTASAAASDETCTKGRPATPGLSLPCASSASDHSPKLTDNLGRKL